MKEVKKFYFMPDGHLSISVLPSTNNIQNKHHLSYRRLFELNFILLNSFMMIKFDLEFYCNIVVYRLIIYVVITIFPTRDKY